MLGPHVDNLNIFGVFGGEVKVTAGFPCVASLIFVMWRGAVVLASSPDPILGGLNCIITLTAHFSGSFNKQVRS